MEIIKYLEEFVDTFMPEDFQWRKGQKEAVISIIEAYKNKSKVVILDAPVGSGKSLIAMAVSWILNQHKIYGYILTSEIALQEQYEKDFKRFKIRWGSIQGIDNYICNDNFEKNSLGTCRIRGKAPKSMYCYSECPYFSARDRAAQSPTSLLNYAYWLIMQNYVNPNNTEMLFPPRDFTFCDEGHKILDIVQNHYSPRFDPKTLEKLEKLTNFFETYKINDHREEFQSLKVNINILFDIENQDKLLKILQDIEVLLEQYRSSWELLKNKVKKEYPHDDPPKIWRDALRLCDWLKDFHCKIEDYVDIINKTSTRNIVKNPSGDDELIFNCLEESYMMNKYFHAHTGFTVLMSATFADPKDYLRSISLNGAKYIRMNSNFNFTKSPIYFYNKRRMSYKQIESNLPWLYERINEILDKHPNENGIIHSASYNLTMKIHNNLSPKNKKRILIYEGTKEKKKVLEILKKSKNKVLIGPSLRTGLDLFDSIARFTIIAKIPYPSLLDKFVAVKLKLNAVWYHQKTIIEILQSIGRTVRHKNDWCVTYILDASLSNLISRYKSSFSEDFFKRLKILE